MAAGARGVPATIVMPQDAPGVKRAATEAYGASVIPCEPTSAAREAAAAAAVAATGGRFVHPSNDPAVMAGQGTLALELLEAVPALQALVVPVGGGGLVSGCTVAAKGTRPGLWVTAAEPALADDAARSKAAGALAPAAPTAAATIADGLRTTLGPNTFPIVRDLVDEVRCVSEVEIRAAMRLVYTRLKVVIEPSAAVGVAVALSPAFRAAADAAGIQHVGVVICGGNVDPDALAGFLRAE